MEASTFLAKQKSRKCGIQIVHGQTQTMAGRRCSGLFWPQLSTVKSTL
jgi:hypothetical protein